MNDEELKAIEEKHRHDLDVLALTAEIRELRETQTELTDTVLELKDTILKLQAPAALTGEHPSFFIKLCVVVGERIALVRTVELPFAPAIGLRLYVGDFRSLPVEYKITDMVFDPSTESFESIISEPEEDEQLWRSLGFTEIAMSGARPRLRLLPPPTA